MMDDVHAFNVCDTGLNSNRLLGDHISHTEPLFFCCFCLFLTYKFSPKKHELDAKI